MEKTLPGPSIEQKVIALPWWKTSKAKLLADILLIIGFSALAAVGKWTHYPGIGVPGSSAMNWLPFLIIGRTVVRRDGAGAIMGIGMATFGLLSIIKLENSWGHNTIEYAITGASLDIMARIHFTGISRKIGSFFSGLSRGLLTGMISHLVKFCIIFGFALAVPATKHFLIVGILQSIGLHIAFGLASGFIAWLVIKGGKKVAKLASPK